VRRYGATVRLCAPTLAAREEACAELLGTTGATLVHPFDDASVIAGQGTAALELVADVPDLDAIIAPVGGGGLLSGSAIAATSSRPGLAVHGAEPANADDAARSLASGCVEPAAPATTIADGLRTTLSPRTLAALRAHVTSIGLATEAGIVRAMRMIWERMKIVVEPSSAVPLAALLEGTLDLRGRRVGVIISGGNVDLDRLPWPA
jgi:threonine dehydratase